jgi:hypothetical protein
MSTKKIKLPSDCTLPPCIPGHEWKLLGWGAKRPTVAQAKLNGWCHEREAWGETGSNWQCGQPGYFYIHAVAAKSPKPAAKPAKKRMREQSARAICTANGLEWSKQANPLTSGSGGNDQEAFREQADAVLAALGIVAKEARK